MISKIRNLSGFVQQSENSTVEVQVEIGVPTESGSEVQKTIDLSADLGVEEVPEGETESEAVRNFTEMFADNFGHLVCKTLEKGHYAEFEWDDPVGSPPLMTTTTEVKSPPQTKAEMVKEFYLYEWNGETHREVANLLNVSVGTVQTGKDMARDEGWKPSGTESQAQG